MQWWFKVRTQYRACSRQFSRLIKEQCDMRRSFTTTVLTVYELGLRKPDLVVAIDVGSTYSGYAWQWRDDFENNKSNVEFNTNWGAGALQSGIKSSQVLLALEPEVAALSCLHLPSQQRESMNNFGNVGDKFVTVDLGGGTADISAIEVLPGGLLKELCSGNGDLVGGQDVNNAFFQTCIDVIQGQIWKDTFCGKNATALLELENEFERRKVAIGRPGERNEYISLSLPFVMHDQLNKGKITLRNTADASSYFRTEGGKFQFKSAFIREKLFDTTVRRILTPIKDTMKNENALGIRTLVLVGGFAESPIVVQRIREQLGQRFPDIKVCVPTSPFRSVLYGAVLFGHDPFIFKSRICKETYGIETNSNFDEKVHDQTKRWTNEDDGKDYCRDIFSVHVKKGQSVVLNENQPSKNYFPMSNNQKRLKLPIFSSSLKTPKYTTDEGCKKLGVIEVDMPDTTGQLSREVRVTMIYGGTELAVKATDVTTGKDFEASINFDVA